MVSNIGKLIDDQISAISLNGTQYAFIASSAAKLQSTSLTLGVVNGETVDFSSDSNLAAKLTATSVATGGSMTVSSDLANVTTITGSGNLTVAGVDGSDNATNLASTLAVTATLNNGVDISANSNLSNVDNFSLNSGASVTMTVAQNNTISAAAGTNTVTLSNAGTVIGSSAVEIYNLASGANTFTTASTAGTTVNGSTGAEEITGGSGGDTLIGGDGNDVLSGGLGDDTITGGIGFDTMTGGGGADTFVFSSTSVADITNPEEIVADFVTGSDQLDFGESKGDVTIVDGSAMLKSTFKSNASTFFDGTGLDVYIAYNVSELGDALVAVDMNKNGTFDDGDLFVKLLGVDQNGEILSSDIV